MNFLFILISGHFIPGIKLNRINLKKHNRKKSNRKFCCFLRLRRLPSKKERENDKDAIIHKNNYFCNAMKRTLLLLLLLLASLTASAQLKGNATSRELRDLVADGKKVFVIFDDKTSDIDEKAEYILEFLSEETEWKVVEKLQEADFILYVEGYSRRSVPNKTYYMTPTIRRPDGTDVWTGETVYDWASLSNGFKAIRAVSRRLVVGSLKAGIAKELGENRKLITV